MSELLEGPPRQNLSGPDNSVSLAAQPIAGYEAELKATFCECHDDLNLIECAWNTAARNYRR